MVQKRCLGVVGNLLTQLEGVPVGHSLTSSSAVARSLDGVHGFNIHLGEVWLLALFLLLVTLKTLGCPQQGCGNMKLRHQSNNIAERLTSFPRVTDTEKTMLFPKWSNPLTRIDSFSFSPSLPQTSP